MIRELAGTTVFIICCAGCSKSAASSKDNSPVVAPVAQITIVGCVQPADQTATDAAGSNDTKYMLTHEKSGNRPAAPAPKLKVETIKMIAVPCPE